MRFSVEVSTRPTVVGQVPNLRNVAQRGDARELLRSISELCSPLGFFDPQYRSNLDKLKYGNEGARQKKRCLLLQMSDEYIDTCCREVARLLRPSGYLMVWADTFRVGEAYHQRVNDVLECVGLIAWDNQRLGQGCRERRCGGYVVVLQKPPRSGRPTWKTKPVIRDRWVEKVDRKIHPHIKPIGLIRALIEATAEPGDLVIDPAAGSFVVMRAAHELGRNFLGCDLAYQANATRSAA